jgi:uncharacterized membrane protein YcaP (DUF421 family)
MQRRFMAPRTFVVLALLATGPLVAVMGLVSPQASATTLRVALAFAVLLAVFRVMGKRELGRLSPFEFVTLMLVPEIVSEVVQGNGDLSASFIGLSTLFLLVLLTSLLSHRFQTVQRLMESSPTLLVANGQLVELNMNRERIAPDELIAEMHKQGIARLADVQWAVLESGGNISCVRFGAGPTASTIPSE